MLNLGHNFLSPLCLWFPHGSYWTGATKGRMFPPDSCPFCSLQNKQTNKPQNKWMKHFYPKCSRKGMGNGKITIKSDFILALMFSPCDLDLSFLSIPLFSVWVRGQEHRENWFFPFFLLLFPLVKPEEQFLVCFLKKKKKKKVAKKSLHSLVWENQVLACFCSSEVKCCHCWTEWLFLQNSTLWCGHYTSITKIESVGCFFLVRSSYSCQLFYANKPS